MKSQILVLDANIIIRGVLGNKVRSLLISNNKSVEFITPDVCVEDAKKFLPVLFEKRGISPNLALEVLSNLESLMQIMDKSIYKEYATEAQRRIKNRDPKDWPVIATALFLNCPIWTEDQDFFGSGLSVWTTDRIPIFFESLYKSQKKSKSEVHE